MPFDSIKKNALAEEILSRLLELIKERELKPGDKLPPERELASMMEVSRPSLREALRALAIMNVVEIRQGAGTYITSLEPGLLVEHLDFVLSLDDSTFVQLFEARKILEVGIVALAAERITEEQIAALDDCLDRSQKNVNNPPAFLQADLDLHEIITRAAGNPILSRTMASISQLGLASRSRTTAIPGVVSDTTEDHRAIVMALKAGDPEAAQKAMLDHLNHVEERLIELIESQEMAESPHEASA